MQVKTSKRCEVLSTCNKDLVERVEEINNSKKQHEIDAFLHNKDVKELLKLKNKKIN